MRIKLADSLHADVHYADARSILSQTSGFIAAAGFTHSLTPARNCTFGCSYCYVPTLGVFGGLKQDDWTHWGTRTTVKANAPDLLTRSLRPGQIIYCSPLVDPYQPAEAVVMMMPRLLEVLVRVPPRVFVVQTRGPLVTRDINLLVRDFTKWDDQPVSLQHFAQSFVRAYKFAMTPPFGPVMIALDAGLQQSPINGSDAKSLYTPRYVASSPPHADPAALRETAKLLVNAQNPVIVADRCARSQEGIRLLVQLAELLQAPVVNRPNRLNFPNTHYLRAASNVIRNADVVLGLELTDFWATVNGWVDNGAHGGHGENESRMRPNAKLIHINSVELNTKANLQDFQRFMPVDISMPADAQSSLPMLIDFVKSAITSERRTVFEQRGAALRKSFAQAQARARQAATLGWDAGPVSTARLTSEIYGAVKDLDWALVNAGNGVSGWPHRLMPMDKHYQWIGGSGAAGLGYGAPASIGAAHGNKSLGRFSVSIQSDGDLMFTSSSLWTAAHHNIPLLSVMHNNRGYHQEVMHVQRLSNRRNRVASLGKTMGPIGTSIEGPDVDYAGLAKSMGWWSAGPLKDPAELGSVLKKAVQVVRAGEPALIDVWTQPR